MAEKKKFSSSKKEKEKKKKIMLTLGAIIVGVTMVLSGMIIGNYFPPPQPQSPIDIVSHLDLKTTEEVTFYVENFLDEFIFISTQAFDWDTLNHMKNMSLRGVQKIEIEYVINKYYIFRFKLDNTTNNTDANFSKNEAFDNIYNTFRFYLNIEDRDNLLGVYSAYAYGIAKKFIIFAPVYTQMEDFVAGTWYIMRTNMTTLDIGIISRIIEKCNNMSAFVKNITSVNVEGATDNPRILDKLGIKATIIDIENPKVELKNNHSINILLKNLMSKYNHTILTESTDIGNISTINFADFVIKVKNLEILNISKNISNASIEIISFEFNSTKEEMERILNASTGTKIKYVINPGKITFEIDANVWNKEIYENIKKNLKDLKINKRAIVSIADSCVHEKMLVVIPENANFNALVNLNRSINDTINVNINLYTITGAEEERHVPFIAVDIDLR